MHRDLTELIARVRQGDEDAAFELVRRYESAIRVAVSTKLSDPRLRRQFDSLDVCQSVLASFFCQMTAGTYDLHSPAQLLALLTTMARNKLGSRTRDQFRRRRDIRRVSQTELEDANIASPLASPTDEFDGRDLVERALAMMTPEIRDIAKRRMSGELWPAIAAAMGGSAEGRRKQFERAMLPIAESLQKDSIHR
jgi:RNA polymerase sigma-70 factor (ECF subfamily)